MIQIEKTYFLLWLCSFYFSDEWLQVSSVKVWHQLRVNSEHGNDEEGNGDYLFNVFEYMSNRLKIKLKTVCGQLSLVGQSVDTVK